MRGTRGVGRSADDCPRNTPADAGNSQPRRSSATECRKHPRRCGELSMPSVDLTLCSETPPQMRGTLRMDATDVQEVGNTPADAGNSCRLRETSCRSRKHPRRCGELFTDPSSSRSGLETPPQMRGTRHDAFLKDGRVGNTPADAGNSGLQDQSGNRSWKHPRRCGELGRARGGAARSTETPPQMRGTHSPVPP